MVSPAPVGYGRSPVGPGHRGVLWWRFPEPCPAVSSASVGGGLLTVSWVLDVGVAHDYRRTDLADHAREVAGSLGLAGTGAALFTAVPVDRVSEADERGVRAWSTVGVTRPTWPADRDAQPWVGRRLPDTVNTVVVLPVALDASALVQAALAATEAKAQACVEAGVPGTGTASDAVVVVGRPGPGETFGGVRSTWGSRVALAVHAAVAAGLEVHP
jgi:adenosylcobinamide hydrolase